MATHSKSQLTKWLMLSCFMIVLMIFVGGLTRLTDSGLSIVEWKPITGIIPPLNNYDWQEEFSKYQTSPEYLKHNINLTLYEFKKIFWLEFVHRLLGRITGLIYFVPLIYFICKKQIKQHSVKLYLAVLILFFLQGFIGWYMVKSGLVDHPYVSHFRLSLHLIIAVIIYHILFTRLMENSFDILLLPNLYLKDRVEVENGIKYGVIPAEAKCCYMAQQKAELSFPRRREPRKNSKLILIYKFLLYNLLKIMSGIPACAGMTSSHATRSARSGNDIKGNVTKPATIPFALHKDTPLPHSLLQKIRKLFFILILIVYIQIFLGGLVAGLDAGLIYNSFPLMGDNLIPAEITKDFFNLDNFSEPVFVQFLHRIGAYVTFIISLLLCWNLIKLQNSKLKKIACYIIIFLFLQIAVGIITLLYSVPIIMALFHQVLAIILLSYILWGNFLVKTA